MDKAEGAVVVLQLFAVEVLVIATGIAGNYCLVMIQQMMGIPHADGQEEEEEQTQAPC
ncbi:MAG: hypothetical protein J5I94_09705 [Phaeodactylibacter sp.]|nr:hypothetical protein [Phaeodactylibacter sp.]